MTTRLPFLSFPPRPSQLFQFYLNLFYLISRIFTFPHLTISHFIVHKFISRHHHLFLFIFSTTLTPTPVPTSFRNLTYISISIPILILISIRTCAFSSQAIFSQQEPVTAEQCKLLLLNSPCRCYWISLKWKLIWVIGIKR